MTRRTVFRRLQNAALFLLGNVLLAFAVAAFVIPTGIITGGATGLPPPAVMLSVLVGGSAFGWAGMLLAIPAVCILRCVWRVLLAERCIPQE